MYVLPEPSPVRASGLPDVNHFWLPLEARDPEVAWQYPIRLRWRSAIRWIATQTQAQTRARHCDDSHPSLDRQHRWSDRQRWRQSHSHSTGPLSRILPKQDRCSRVGMRAFDLSLGAIALV